MPSSPSSSSALVVEACRPAPCEPHSVEAKRTPSSSPKATTSMANGKRLPDLNAAFTTSIAVTTPSGPSNRPALRTVSMCEPIISVLRPPSRASITADDAGQRIDAHRHAGFAHPIGDQVGGAAVRRPEIKPREAAGLVAERRQLDEPVGDRLAECQLVRRLRQRSIDLYLKSPRLNGGIARLGQSAAWRPHGAAVRGGRLEGRAAPLPCCGCPGFFKQREPHAASIPDRLSARSRRLWPQRPRSALAGRGPRRAAVRGEFRGGRRELDPAWRYGLGGVSLRRARRAALARPAPYERGIDVRIRLARRLLAAVAAVHRAQSCR